jgi:hypothetical protein
VQVKKASLEDPLLNLVLTLEINKVADFLY